MTIAHRLVVAAFKGLTSLMCRIDAAQLARVPDRGPLIIVFNHVNMLEIPVLYTRQQPRPVSGMLRADRWDNRLLGWMLDVCETIPLHRDEADVVALHRGIDALRAGRIVMIAPEGTRSHDGRLQPARAGVVLMALHSGASILPVVHYGSENYRADLRRLRRADFHIVVGEPFRLDAGGQHVTRSMRQAMLDAVMARMAALLPLEYRGVYANRPVENNRFVVPV
jgi:1-acyl-sn-glycerol-3-phosphate acyltransferase